MRLSDFQVVDAPIPVDPAVMKKNATAAGSVVDWKATKIHITQAAREKDPFRIVNSTRKAVSYGRDADEESPQRTGRNRLMHQALDWVLDELERRKTSRRTTSRSSAMDSEQRSQGGGCGRSYACDVGNLSAANYIRMQKRRRVGKLV